MKYKNLTQQQKEWISEIQRYFTLRENIDMGLRKNDYASPRIIADSKTGEVFETFQGDEVQPIGIIRKLGEIPIKAIPYRNSRPITIERIVRYEIQGRLI